MTTNTAIAAIKARLEGAPSAWPQGHSVFDGEPDGDTGRPYVCIWDQTGVRVREKYTGQAGRTLFPFQLSCVARTREGLRQLVDLVRGTVLDWPPVDGATPIVEDGSNPILTEGTGNDVRLVAPLTMHCYLPKET